MHAQHRLEEADAVVDDYAQRVEALKAERGSSWTTDADPDLDALDLKPLVLRHVPRPASDRSDQRHARSSSSRSTWQLPATSVRRANDDLSHARLLRVPVPDDVTDSGLRGASCAAT